MTKTYLSYSFSLLSALMVWWVFGLFASVAAGFTWIPFSAFIASIIQFGVTSWLFLFIPKWGKILSIIVTIIMCIWPIVGFANNIKEKDSFLITYFIIVIGLCVTVIFNHFRTIKDNWKPKIRIRIILSLIPFLIFILYILTTYKYFI